MDAKALYALKYFLEITPANQGVDIPGLLNYTGDISLPPTTGWGLNLPIIELHCENDNGSRIFEPSIPRINTLAPPYETCFCIMYRCRNCQAGLKTFAIYVKPNNIKGDVSDVKVMKLGEYPPFSAPISSRIQRLLTAEDLELYRKGTRSEAQGLGIGAATYFRRIVDEQWKHLVQEIRKAAERLGISDLSVYDKALKETQFSKAVDILKNKIPNKLLILDRKNPLTLLHRQLSQQLHELTDEECLQQAADIRVVLTALLENIAEVLKDQNQLREAVSRLNS